ncbi:hypothetical protein LZ554_001437 [Drepanopeziza brunnea f. sp. 'monogermtubi']|nr:hypothetical protein LZ554_001437 [Drepanopeziza brunnea f. sp. 'monogermtubi']
MYLNFTSVLKGLFTFGSTTAAEPPAKIVNSDGENDHVYIRGDISDRGPCPALNALANQGYLPRDGRNITITDVHAVLKSALHFDGPLAANLAQSLKPIVRKDGTFDLFDMRKHNVLEHDRSVTRFDFRQGDNYTFQPTLFQALLADADGGPVTLASLAKTYNRRKKESRAAGSPALPMNLWFVNLLQTVSLLNTAQVALDRDLLVEFYRDEKIPDVVLQNHTPRTLYGLVGKALLLLFHSVF